MMHEHVGRENALVPLSIADFKVFDADLRVRDIRLGEVLGFERPRKIRELIEANLEEIQSYGSCAPIGAMIVVGKGAKREVQEYWLNEPQALLISGFARTANGAAVRRQMIEIFMAWRHGKLEPKKHVFSGELTFSQRVGFASTFANAIANRIGFDGNEEVRDAALEWAFERLGPMEKPAAVHAPPTPRAAKPPRAAPVPSGLVTLNYLEKWWFERLMAGSPVPLGCDWPELVPCKRLYLAYFDAAGVEGVRDRYGQIAFGIKIGKLVPGLGKRRRSGEAVPDGRCWYYALPALEDCRIAFEQLAGRHVDWSKSASAGEIDLRERPESDG